MAHFRVGLGAIGGAFMLSSVIVLHMTLVLLPLLWHRYLTERQVRNP